MDKVNLTGQVLDRSIQSVRDMIKAKNSSQPFLATNNIISNSLTDMDHHPYSRWYRGVYYYPDPVIMERQVGWRPIEQQCYNVNVTYEVSEPINCFENPCTTMFPCFPSQNQRFDDKNKLLATINSNCSIPYR